MICCETEKEAQSAITEINRSVGWTAEKYIKKSNKNGKSFQGKNKFRLKRKKN